MSLKRPGTLIMLMAIALFVTAAVYAQGAGDQTGAASSQGQHEPGRHTGPPSPAMELDRLSRAMKTALLPLSDAQKVTILGIYEDRETAMNALRQQTANNAAPSQEVRALMDASRASVRATLTEPQARIFDSLRPMAPPHNASGMGASQAPQEGERPLGPPAQAPSTDSASPGGSALNDENSLIDANTGGAPQSSPAQ